MATPLKNYFDAATVRGIARDIAAVHPAFPEAVFVADACRGLGPLALTERGRHVADALARHLPNDLPAAAAILTASLPPIEAASEAASDGSGLGPLRYLPHVFFAARYGLEHFEPAMALQIELTKRFSAEYSIRAFIEKYPDATYARLTTWASDPNLHVRRLVSEGTRPRLPWAQRLRAYQRDPAPVIALLERLKDDPALYVRRSVANNLNDIGKDHPALLVEIGARWLKDASPERQWIVRHALRSLIKRGDRGALALFGCAAAPRVRIEGAQLSPRRLREGDVLRLALELVSTDRAPQDLMVDYVVHFVKASGKTSPKVFKLQKVALPARGRLPLAARVSFAPMTTRRHHPGVHRIELLVNGVAMPLGEIRVVP